MSLHHHLGVSAFADHAVVAPESAIPIPDDLPFELAALFGCAVLTGVGAVVNAAHVTPDDQVAVFGLGGVGMSAVLGARLAGARTIIAVDTVAEQAGARRSGSPALSALPRATTSSSAIRAATGGGADCAIETVGNAEVLAQAYAATRRGGTTITVGLPHPDRMLTIPAVSLAAEERTLRGSYLGSSVPAPRRPAVHRALPRRPSSPSSSSSPTGWRWTRSTRALTAWPGARRSARSSSSRELTLRLGARSGSAVFVDVLGIDAEADPGLPGEVSRVLAVPLGLPHRIGERVLALVDERGAAADRDVMQVVTIIVHDQRDPRVATDVGHPATIPVSVESQVVLTKHVVDDDLAGRAIRPECGQHRTSRGGEERARRVDEKRAVAHP